MSTSVERNELQLAKKHFDGKILGSKEYRGELYILVSTDAIVDVLEFFKSDARLQYDYFSECVGVDYSTWTHARDFPAPKRFEVVYNLMNYRTGGRVFLKVTVDDGEAIPTAKEIFAGAEYPEREIQDLFGVTFTGNPEPKGMRFMLPDDWIGFPLRKEYPLGGEDVVFDKGTLGPAVEDVSLPHAGESFEGKTGSADQSGR